MNRDEATNLLREILATCGGISADAIMLMPPNADDLLSHGYQLHIKPLPAGDIACIKPLVDKSNLKLAEEPEKDLLIIYRPMNQP